MRPGSADATQPAKPRWGDLDEDGDKELDLLLLPPKQVIGPNEKGIKKVIEYKFNEDGHKVKITTTTRIKSHLMTKAAVDRHSWAKFGDAVDDDAGASLTVVSKDEVMLERPKALGTNMAHELPKTNEGGNTTLKLCRTCGKKGDHWTAQCPYKDLATQSTGDISSSETGTTSKTGTYVPPGMRPGAKKVLRGMMRIRFGLATFRRMPGMPICMNSLVLLVTLAVLMLFLRERHKLAEDLVLLTL
ncbi:hypothetical protein ACLB2K_008796 [Fragaria x ananassa]